MCLNGTPCDRGKHWDGCRRQNIGGWKKATLSLRIIYGTQFTLHHFHLFLSWMKNTFAVGWRRSLQRGFAFIDAHFIPRDRRERESGEIWPRLLSAALRCGFTLCLHSGLAYYWMQGDHRFISVSPFSGACSQQGLSPKQSFSRYFHSFYCNFLF